MDILAKMTIMTEPADVNYRSLIVLYILLTFSITWGIALFVIIFPEVIRRYLGQISVFHPLYFLAVYSPTVSATAIVITVCGWRKATEFLKRIVSWRIGFRSYVFSFGLVLGTFFLIRFIENSLGIETPTFTFAWYMFLPYALLYLVLDAGPVGEELGWRGFLLPLLQNRFSSIGASLVLGVIWATWHLPAFFISNMNQAGRSIVNFYLVIIAFNMLVVQIYNLSRGSVLITVILHWCLNLDTYLHITGDSRITNLIVIVVFSVSAIAIRMRYAPKEVRTFLPGSAPDLILNLTGSSQ